MDLHESSTKTAAPDGPGSNSTSEARELRIRAAARHNVLHLVVAALGVVLLATAFLDWLIHPLTLWTAVP